jgi:hypothetical protein
MSNGHTEDLGIEFSENDPEREPFPRTLLMASVNVRQWRGMLCDSHDGSVNSVGESSCGDGATVRIPIERLVKVPPRIGKEVDRQHHSVLRVRRLKAPDLICSQGTVTTNPASYSADRFSISANHSSESGGSESSGKVSQRASISWIRSTIGKREASESSES